jgi:poly(3-hydroxybutyrate) depolymerase
MTTNCTYQILIHGGRPLLIFVPSQLPSAGQCSVLIVLHGGLGNAQRKAARFFGLMK